MIASLLSLAAALGAASPPKASIHSVFSTDDYPADAVRKRQQGIVGVRISVDETGGVSRCTIAKSSGVPILDSTTCDILRTRVHYEPARDRTGRAITGSDRVKIKWVLPTGDNVPVADNYTRFSFDLSAEGAASHCVPEFNGKPGDPSQCSATLANYEKIDSDTRKDFITYGRKLAFLDGYILGRDEVGSLLTSIAGGGHIEGFTRSLTINARGKVTRCELALYDWEFPSDKSGGPCNEARKTQFEALSETDPNQGDRNLTLISAVIISN